MVRHGHKGRVATITITAVLVTVYVASITQITTSCRTRVPGSRSGKRSVPQITDHRKSNISSFAGYPGIDSFVTLALVGKLACK